MLRYVAAQGDAEQGGGYVSNDCMAVLANVENPVLAHAFLNYVLDTKVAIENMSYGYQPPQKSLDPTSSSMDGTGRDPRNGGRRAGRLRAGPDHQQLTPGGRRRWLGNVVAGSSRAASGVSKPDDEGVGRRERWLWPSLAALGVSGWSCFSSPALRGSRRGHGSARSHLRGFAARVEPVGVTREFGTIFGEIFTGQLGVVFLRTLVYVAVATFLSLLIGYPVAYYVARHAGRYRAALMLIIAPFWINYLMRMLAG